MVATAIAAHHEIRISTVAINVCSLAHTKPFCVRQRIGWAWARRPTVRQRTDTAAALVHIEHLRSSSRCMNGSRPLTGVHEQKQVMGINNDLVEGRVDEVKGAIKEVAGKLVGSERMEAKGKIQQNLGKVQAKVGDVTDDNVKASPWQVMAVCAFAGFVRGAALSRSRDADS
jgi:uncharacterized protein YjbJ (UPF0337 family)